MLEPPVLTIVNRDNSATAPIPYWTLSEIHGIYILIRPVPFRRDEKKLTHSEGIVDLCSTQTRVFGKHRDHYSDQNGCL